MSAGRALRKKSRGIPITWTAPSNRPNTIAVLWESDRGRLPELLPIWYGRMQQSSYEYFRSSAAVRNRLLRVEDRGLGHSPTSERSLLMCA
jgi:hypothetical protein